MQKIGDNIYVETGLPGCVHGFVVTGEGVVMIDTPQMPVDAVRWRDEIAKHGPVRYLINTEPHGDHFTGNYFFEGTIVAHQGTREGILAATIEQLKERLKDSGPENLSLIEGYSYRPPTITFSQRLTLHLGDHTFQLINLPGHTPFQVAVYIPEERMAFTADNIFHKAQTFLHQAVPYQWLESLKRIEELDVDVLVPGHGSICDRSYIPEQRAIVQSWIDAITNAIEQGMSLEEAQEKLPFIDRYFLMGSKDSPMSQRVHRISVAGMYEALKK